MRTVFTLTAVLVMFLVAFTASGAGFDCHKAGTPVEKMICADNRLSQLDSQLFGKFRRVMKESLDKQYELERQRNWLRDKRDVCNSNSCLQAAYNMRLLELKNTYADVPEDLGLQPDVSLNPVYYVDHVVNSIYSEDGVDYFQTNTLLVQSRNTAKLKFGFILHGDNGHTCQMNGEAKATAGDHFVYAPPAADQSESGGDCQLGIRFKGKTALLEDKNDACHEIYCGARAYISGTTLNEVEK